MSNNYFFRVDFEKLSKEDLKYFNKLWSSNQFIDHKYKTYAILHIHKYNNESILFARTYISYEATKIDIVINPDEFIKLVKIALIDSNLLPNCLKKYNREFN